MMGYYLNVQFQGQRINRAEKKHQNICCYVNCSMSVFCTAPHLQGKAAKSTAILPNFKKYSRVSYEKDALFSDTAVRNSYLALEIFSDDTRTFEKSVWTSSLCCKDFQRNLNRKQSCSSATDWSVRQTGLCQHKATNSPSSTSSTFPFLASSSPFCLRSVLL
jgi:hypothetical protein